MRNFLEQVRRARRDEKPYQQRVQQQLGKAEDAWWKDGLDDFIAKQESDSTLAYARYQTDFWQPATGGNRQTSNARQSSTYTNAMSKDWSRVGQQDDDHLDNQFNQPQTPQTYAAHRWLLLRHQCRLMLSSLAANCLI